MDSSGPTRKHRSVSEGTGPERQRRENDMSDRLTPDNVFVEDGGETYEDLVNLSEDDE